MLQLVLETCKTLHNPFTLFRFLLVFAVYYGPVHIVDGPCLGQSVCLKGPVDSSERQTTMTGQRFRAEV